MPSNLGIPALALLLTAPAATAEPTVIIRTRPVELPAYDDYRGIERYAPTAAEYAEAVADRRFVLERITYRSGELEVDAYLYRPAAPPTGARMPVVVFNRGSWVRDDFAPEVLMPARRLAGEGFVTVAPFLRGSGGAGGRDEMGGAEIADVLALVSAITELPYADSERLYLYGESRGGLTCLLAARAGFPARAAAVYGAIGDYGDYLAEGRPARAIAPRIWPDFAERETEIVAARSAVRWAGEIGPPLLVLHGGDDRDVSPLQALALAGALEQAGKRYELHVYQGADHVLTGRAAERDAEAARWFRRWSR